MKLNKKQKAIFILMVVIIFLVILDIPLTLLGISKFGIDVECNKTVKNLIENGQEVKWILMKGVSSFLFFSIILIYFKSTNKVKKFKNMSDYIILIFLAFIVLIFLFITLSWVVALIL